MHQVEKASAPRRRLAATLLLSASLAFCATATAQQKLAPRLGGYPTKPVRVLVGSPAGSGSDLMMRAVALRLTERWGQQVTALVKLRPGERASEASLLDEAAAHLAAYKLPKAFVFVDELVRAPSGKADYRWARATALARLGETPA